MTATAPRATAGAEGLGERDARALDILRRHSDHSSAFLAFNAETQHFMTPDIDGLVAYRLGGRRHAVQLCGPFAAPEDRVRMLRAFRDWARSEGRTVTAVQLRREEAQLYAQEGFKVNQLGSSFSLDLEQYTLKGKRYMKLRNKISQSRKKGVTVEELSPADLDRPEIARELEEIDATWLKGKGRFAKQLSFMIGERDGRGQGCRRVFLARDKDGKALAYVTYSPVWGSQPGWLYDLTRRGGGAPPGVIDLIFHTVVEQLREEEVRWLHLGLTPVVELDPEHELAGHSKPVRKVVELIHDKGDAIYPARSQLEFKNKWNPQQVEPEYVGFEGRPSPGAVWHLLRLTRAI